MQKNIILFMVLLCASSLLGAAKWLDPAWKYRQKISVKEGFYVVNNDLKNFPVLISLNGSEKNLFLNAKENGGDIVFTASDGTTKLPHEIEDYSKKNKRLSCWVGLPKLLVEGNTNMYVYYGNPSATANKDFEKVWSNGYAGVWHLNKLENRVAIDSTKNHNNGKAGNNIKIVSEEFAGNVAEFTNHGVINCGNGASLNFSVGNSFTVEARVLIKSHSGFILLRKGLWSMYYHKLKRWYFRIVDDPKSRGKNLSVFSVDASVDTWRYLVGVYDAKEKIVSLYVDGLFKIKSKPDMLGDFSSKSSFQIGQPWKAKGVQFLVDEVRISNVARSGGWIAATHKNQSFPGQRIKFKKYETYK